MTVEWSDSRIFFPEHNECMRRFRRAHADVAWVNKPNRDELARLDSMRPLQVTHPVMETGESRFHSSTTNWSALVPVLKVAAYKLSPN